jgi:hypothetical protein
VAFYSESCCQQLHDHRGGHTCLTHPRRRPVIRIAAGQLPHSPTTQWPCVLAREVSAQNRVLESRLFELASAAEGLNRRIHDTKRTSTFTRTDARKVRKAARAAAGDNEELQPRAINALQYLTRFHIRSASASSSKTRAVHCPA